MVAANPLPAQAKHTAVTQQGDKKGYLPQSGSVEEPPSLHSPNDKVDACGKRPM